MDVFLTGSGNFRYTVNPNYKANRKDARRPKWLHQIREHLVTKWGASVSNGTEADDEMGIAQDKETKTTLIATIDKDLLMIPGLHYNFVKGIHREVTKVDGKRWLYYQTIMGDKADNIFGYDGKCRDKVPQFLQPTIDELNSLDKERDMYEFVLDLYQMNGQGKEAMHMNAHCLYIWHKEDDKWEEPTV